MDNISNLALDDHLNDTSPLSYQSCFYCGGYYGNCHGEPVCGVCHDFLFAEDYVSLHELSRSDCTEKDDCDSGNDEPSEDAGPASGARVPEAGVDESPSNQDAPQVFFQQLPSASNWVAPPDRMSQRIQQLTTPWATHELPTTDKNFSLLIPPEIWAIIFRKLDDLSLLMATKVSPRWKTIIQDQCPNEKWKDFFKTRWPLFNSVYTVIDWYSVYSDFVDSVPCKRCLMDLNAVLPNIDNTVRSLRSARLHKESKWLRFDHPEGIEAVPLDKLNYNWLARVNGPPKSPYQGGVFYLNLKITHEYPLKPPVVRFLTKIFHPNVSRHGDIGIDCIQHNWTLALTIPQILLSVQSLLTDPFLHTRMEVDAALLYENDRQTFDKIAKIWTWKYAMNDILLH